MLKFIQPQKWEIVNNCFKIKKKLKSKIKDDFCRFVSKTEWALKFVRSLDQ